VLEGLSVRVAFITLGQSPRDDIMVDIKPYLEEVECVEYGALDGLPLNRVVKEFSPLPNEVSYVSRLRDGTEVVLSKSKISVRLQSLVSLVEGSVDLIVILCTGDFNLSSRTPIIYPSVELVRAVRKLSPSSIGVIVPLSSQVVMARNRWGGIASIAGIEVWSPYTGSAEDLANSALRLRRADIIVMDCLGYSLKHKEVVREVSGRRTIVPREVVVSAIKEALIYSIKERRAQQ